MSRAQAKTIKTPGDVTASEASAPLVAVDDVAGLPNAVDVDPRFLKGPVLSRQGWLVPDLDWQQKNPAEFKAGPTKA